MLLVRRQLLLPDSAVRGDDVRVAVLDTGIDPEHPDFSERIDLASSKEFVSSRCDLVDRNGHGSSIAGIIGGSGSASNGLYRGIAPGCTLIIYKIANGRRALEANAAAAIGAALEARVDIIHYSHGTSGPGQAPWVWPTRLHFLEEAFEEAARRGILCVVAAGNSGPSGGSITRPGGLQRVLTVGAVGQDGRVLRMSSRGPFRRHPELRHGQVERWDPSTLERDVRIIRKPDVVVPGEAVAPRTQQNCYPFATLGADGDADLDGEERDPFYVFMKGSSQATAVASGLAACLINLARENAVDLGSNPGQTLRRLFVSAARPLDGHSAAEMGNGLILWPILAAALEDFKNDEQFRRVILEGNDTPKLL